MKYKIILVFLIIGASLQAFQSNGIPLIVQPGEQTEAKILVTSSGDFYVVYKDYDQNRDWHYCMVGKFDKNGEPLWPSPIKVCESKGSQRNHQAVITPLGEILIVFEDNRKEYDILQVYISKIGINGEYKWNPEGIAISPTNSNQYTPQLCLSEEGEDFGAWICWTDYRNYETTGPDVWLARITKEGEVRWEVPVCSLSNERERPNLVSSKNGALVFWVEKRNDTLGIFGNRVVEDSFQWGRNGKLLLPYSYGFESLIRPDLPPQYTVTDRSGGAYLFPAHYGVGGVQRVDTLGNLLFDSIPSVAIPYSIASTKDHGVVGCYSLSGGPDVLYQHVKIAKIDSSGARPWGPSFRVWTSPVMDTTHGIMTLTARW